jgi:hypothetical protein
MTPDDFHFGFVACQIRTGRKELVAVQLLSEQVVPQCLRDSRTGDL